MTEFAGIAVGGADLPGIDSTASDLPRPDAVTTGGTAWGGVPTSGSRTGVDVASRRSTAIDVGGPDGATPPHAAGVPVPADAGGAVPAGPGPGPAGLKVAAGPELVGTKVPGAKVADSAALGVAPPKDSPGAVPRAGLGTVPPAPPTPPTPPTPPMPPAAGGWPAPLAPYQSSRRATGADVAARVAVVGEQVDFALAEIALARAAFRRACEEEVPGWPWLGREIDTLRRPRVARALARELDAMERLRVWAQELYWLQEQAGVRGFR